ncbi:alpha/beta hydrolase [Curtobacterium sp. 22159]|uniref:alpha/beta hydrolase n=1 Tax=Curtobacterium sp. 22159 TaxID=3453882 RepID=UPI003F83FF04
MTISLLSAHTLLASYAVTGLLTVVLLIVTRRSWRALLIAAAVGAGVGVLLTWWLGDVIDVLGVAPTSVDRVWVAVACALLAVAVVGLVRGRALTKGIAAVLVPAAVLSAGLAVNRDAGLFPTVTEALGQSHIRALRLPDDRHPSGQQADVAHWQAPADMPRTGRYGSVTIPGSVSRFPARPAVVYLPPAALVEHAPMLPVVVMLSGQGPGAAPANIVEAGRMASRLDALAAEHHGLAPIVVMPDQLGEATRNPMCVDGPLGDSATYLTRDVPDWVREHLHVAAGPSNWAISGFSQGGTCALQLGATDPDLFGSWIDVSGQLGPTLQDRSDTVARGFGGDERAYEDAQPLRILQQDAPYSASAAFIAAGADDHRYGPNVQRVAAAAEAAGVQVTAHLVPDGGHDWHTAGHALQEGVAWFMRRTGLAEPR